MAINGVSGSSGSNSAATVDPQQTGFNALTADSFLKILVTQLQNQDPTNPVSNEDLLNQISSLRALQSNIELGQTLKSLSLNQQLASGTSYIGKAVTGTATGSDGKPTEISGVVDRVMIRNGSTLLGIGNQEVAVDKISEIHASN
jgi:flagellar basal-body rod modification protein FlgD